MIARLLLSFVILFWPLAAAASEQFDNFNVEITVQKSGDILVTETIEVTAEGKEIRRGIFRDLPRYYTKSGRRYPYHYDVQAVMRDGHAEPYAKETDGNAFRLRIGDADRFLTHGPHTYVIKYAVKNQIRYFDSYDEIYWNATGSYWAFPIASARAVVTLPENARVTAAAAYTGAKGSKGGAYEYKVEGARHIFTTTKPLNRREGLTVAVGFEKGAVDPPSAAERRAEWWARNMSLIILAGALGLLSTFYAAAFHLVGRDPQKGPVFPRYEPPEGFSPAAVHHVYHRHFAGHSGLISALLNLAVKDRIRIDAKDKKKTVLTLLAGDDAKTGSPAEEALLGGVFNRRETVTLGGGYDASFTKAYEQFRKSVGQNFGKPYFRWNAGFLVLAVMLAVIGIVLAAVLSIEWTLWHTGLAVMIAAATATFSYLIPAPTMKGQEVRTEIEGFRLYLKTAEQLQLNAAKPGSDTPPPMTVERYERFLPYAVALGVEKPWTEHFEKLLPMEAEHYQPRWGQVHGGHHSLHGLNSALVAGISSGVVSAMPQSSGSSGSGGGGFSGGGGGGGGGGGW